MSGAQPTAAAFGLLTCGSCVLLVKPPPAANGCCPRCGAQLRFRKPESMARTWALVITAAILYIPANMLPMMYTNSLFGAQRDTILSGITYLWTSGSWPLALVVFFASFALPLFKIISLAGLLVSVHFGSRWRPVQRARLYRLVSGIGHWSAADRAER